MNYIDFQNTYRWNIIISKNDILKFFPDFDNKNLTYWQRKWYIKKLVKSYYYFADIDIDLAKTYFISNNIYSPSYISSFQALGYYWLIPEHVVYITWISTNKTELFKTPIWIFKYHSIKKELFWWYNSVKFGQYSFYIADIEKTILDFFYFNKQYKTKNDILELRFDYEVLKEKLNEKTLLKYLKIFKNKPLTDKIFIFLDLLKNA